MRISIRNIHRRPGSVGAFTLPEAMIAVLIAAVMIGALYSCFTFGYGTVKLAREDLRATQILLQKLEILRLTSFKSVKNSSTTDYFDPGAINKGTVYSVTVATNAVTASDMPVQPVYYMNKMLKVTATATWTNGTIVRTRSLQTYASQSGIQSYVYNHK
jgi:Tfp pilus assembly protein PilV